jgi:hypothetical protein
MTINTNAEFMATQADNLESLFSALGRQHEWTDDLDELVDYTQIKWVGSEHGNTADKDQFSPEQEGQALEVLASMGFKHEILPEAGNYEQIVVVGGLMRVNRQRLDFLKKQLQSGLVNTDKVVFWAGQRPRDQREDAELRAVDLKVLSHHDWIRQEAVKPVQPGASSRFASETDLARLAYLEQFPEASLQASDIPNLNNYSVQNFPNFSLLDAPKVSRPQGPSRHTTASCTSQWLDLMPPQAEAKILLIAGNPHSQRSLKEVEQAAANVERSDIEFKVSGPAANPKASVQLYLGEVGRLLYMDAQSSSLT